MNYTGHARLPAPPQAVWDALHDPELLKACLPGCEAMEKTGPDSFQARVAIRIGVPKLLLQGKAVLSELDPPYRFRLTGEAQAAGAFAKGDAVLLLAPGPAGTDLSYSAQVTVGGRLSRFAQRQLDDAEDRLARAFLGRLGAALDAAAAPPVPPRPDNMGSAVWLSGLGAVLVILALLVALVV